MFTNASEKEADSAATTRSPASASDRPAPAAGPFTAVTTGLGISRMRVTIGWYQVTRADLVSTCPSASLAADRPSLRSAPEQNARPAPVSMTARTWSSAATSVSTLSRSAESSLDQAFSRSGRFSSIFTAPGAR